MVNIRSNMGKRYSVYDDTQYPMMYTDSFCNAVKYAKSNGWVVFDHERKMIVYDGAGDELTV